MKITKLLLLLSVVFVGGCSISTLMTTFDFDFYVSDKVFTGHSCQDMYRFRSYFEHNPIAASMELLSIDYYPEPIPDYTLTRISENVALAFNNARKYKGC